MGTADMYDPVEIARDALARAGCSPNPTGRRKWAARCPIHRHGGRTDNLTLREGDDGRALLYCHHKDSSGNECSIQDILNSLELEMKDLYPQTAKPSTNGRSRGKAPERGPQAKPGPSKPPKQPPKEYDSPNNLLYPLRRLGERIIWTYHNS